MRTYQDTAFAVLDRYIALYVAHKTDAGVCSGRRFWVGYQFHFTMLWKVFLIELRD